MHLFEKRGKFTSRGFVVSILSFALLAFLFILMLNQVQEKSEQEQVKLLEDALNRAAITCYAIEGRYPPSVSYITENFVIVVDEEKYIISYDAFASNVMPSISVLIKGAALE